MEVLVCVKWLFTQLYYVWFLLASAAVEMCELFVISVVCLLFRYRHLATRLVHTHPECSQQWQVRWTSLSVCVRVCIFTLIDYRCTAGLVGCSRQWKWAWPPLRKRDSSHRHTTHSSYRHRHSVTCEGKESSHAQDFKAHFAHSHTLTNN